MDEPATTLPEPLDPERLRALDAPGLDDLATELRAAERAVIAAMAPQQRLLREVQTRLAELATEQRRRERAERHAARIAVRQQASSGEMPSLTEALEAPASPVDEDRPLREVRAFLRSGGEVRFGYATRPGTIDFTDGRRRQQAGTFGEARRLHDEGWDPGVPGVPGVRIHLLGTRIERVAPAGDVVLERSADLPSQP